MTTLYELLDKLEALIETWENVPYTGDLTKAARANCARELREVLGQPERHWVQDSSSNDTATQRGYYQEELPF